MNALTLNNLENVLQHSFTQAVLFVFWAPFSPESQHFLNVLEEESAQLENLSLYAANVEETPALAQYFAVQSLPALKLIHNGQLLNEANGALSIEQLRVFLKDFIQIKRDFHAEIQAAMQQNIQEALKLAQWAVQRNPTDEVLRLDLAEIYLTQKNSDLAKTILNEPFLTQTKRHETLVYRLKCLENAPDLTPLQNALKNNPNDLSLQLQLARALFDHAAFEEAFNMALAVLAKDKNFEENAAQKMLLDFFKTLETEQFDDLLRQKRRAMARLLN